LSDRQNVDGMRIKVRPVSQDLAQQDFWQIFELSFILNKIKLHLRNRLKMCTMLHTVLVLI